MHLVKAVEPRVVHEPVAPVEAELMDEGERDVVTEERRVRRPVGVREGHVIAHEEELDSGQQGNEHSKVEGE